MGAHRYELISGILRIWHTFGTTAACLLSRASSFRMLGGPAEGQVKRGFHMSMMQGLCEGNQGSETLGALGSR